MAKQLIRLGHSMRRLRLSFVKGLDVEFIDREQAIKRVEEWAREGMVNVQVVFGPEGCGKTAWLKQSAEILRELGFEVVYINPIEKEVLVETGIEDVKKKMMSIITEASGDPWIRATWMVIDLARAIIAMGKGRLAVLVDDAFQVIGLNKAAIYVKGLLGLIEYPPRPYDVIIAVAATSEGLSRYEIGRHRWADMRPMWNIPKEGFKQLYEQIPGKKPDLEEVWKLTGGNPKILARLYANNWDVKGVTNDIMVSKKLRQFTHSLNQIERQWLWEAVDNPDTLFTRERMGLLGKLVELNLAIDDVPMREQYLWVDQPPPEADPELGIGKYVAWQTPLHREAVRKALEEA